MTRRFAALLLLAFFAGLTASAAASYKIEHLYAGNDNSKNDRIYARDVVTRKRLVLSRHWGRACRSPGALDYGLGGGCWYPVRENYSDWQRKWRGWSL